MLIERRAGRLSDVRVGGGTTLWRPKILFFSSARYSWPLDPTSEKKFAALAALGEIFVVGFSTDRHPRRCAKHANFYLLPQLPWAVLRYGEIFLAGWLIVGWLILRRQARLLVAQSPYEGFVAALAKRVARWFGARVILIIESHGDFEQSYFLYRRVRLRQLYDALMRGAARIAFANADLLRAVSNATRDQLKRWAPDKPVFEFFPWTDLDVFVEAGCAQTGYSSSDILFVGVVTPLKGVHHLIDAFALLAGAFLHTRLLIIGRQDDGKYLGELQYLVASRGLTARVSFIPPLDQSELAARMKSAAMLVLPSESEGLGRVILEAMATGIPVIGSRVGGIPDLVEDGVTGFLVPAGDAMALAEKIRWLLSNAAAAREMAQRARTYARGKFSTDAYVEGYRRMVGAGQSLLERGAYASSAL